MFATSLIIAVVAGSARPHPVFYDETSFTKTVINGLLNGVFLGGQTSNPDANSLGATRDLAQIHQLPVPSHYSSTLPSSYLREPYPIMRSPALSSLSLRLPSNIVNQLYQSAFSTGLRPRQSFSPILAIVRTYKVEMLPTGFEGDDVTDYQHAVDNHRISHVLNSTLRDDAITHATSNPDGEYPDPSDYNSAEPSGSGIPAEQQTEQPTEQQYSDAEAYHTDDGISVDQRFAVQETFNDYPTGDQLYTPKQAGKTLQRHYMDTHAQPTSFVEEPILSFREEQPGGERHAEDYPRIGGDARDSDEALEQENEAYKADGDDNANGGAFDEMVRNVLISATL